MEARLLNKITIPRISQLIPRKQLFERLRQSDQASALWIAGPAGSGRTSLVAGYLAADHIPAVWYQIDVGDGDPSTFFYYLVQAATPFSDPPAKPLPLLTPEYLLGMETFTIRYFEKLFQRLTAPAWIVFDNFQELPADATVPMF
jgi:ATP/maltotriose-dependent transcriptional regulator MalT